MTMIRSFDYNGAIRALARNCRNGEAARHLEGGLLYIHTYI